MLHHLRKAKRVVGAIGRFALSISTAGLRAVRVGLEKIVIPVFGLVLGGKDVKRFTPIGSEERTKPHFLIARYRFYCNNPSLGDSTEKFMLDGTLRATGLATADTFFWDRDYTTFPCGDSKLLAKCRSSRPDAVVLSSYSPGNLRQPSVETIRILREKWNIPIIALWWDTCSDGFLESIRPVLELIDVHVVPDNPLLTFAKEDISVRGRFLALWVPLDPSIYNNPRQRRDISVSFLGQAGSYRSYRAPYIRYLIERKVPIHCSLVERASQPSHAEYVEVLKRSKIGLNFSYSVSSDQLKARVFETLLCGALLMESENPQTRCYFSPMSDYVTFSSKEDLFGKVKYFLEHEDERAEIAARGEQKARQHYNHTEFWRRVTEKLGEVTKR